MDIREMIFNRNKYMKVTNGDQVLIAIGVKTSIQFHNTKNGSAEDVEDHAPCLAWAILQKDPADDQYYNWDKYHIKSFVGNPKGNGGYLNERLTRYDDVQVPAREVIAFGGVLGSHLTHLCQAFKRAFTRNEVIACL